MSVVCLRTFREQRRVVEVLRDGNAARAVEPSGWSYAEVKAGLEARFGDSLPARWKAASIEFHEVQI